MPDPVRRALRQLPEYADTRQKVFKPMPVQQRLNVLSSGQCPTVQTECEAVSR
jgi:hypothetical protein